MALTQDSGVRSSNKTPVLPSITVSAIPPLLYPITGQQAMLMSVRAQSTSTEMAQAHWAFRATHQQRVTQAMQATSMLWRRGIFR